MQSHKVRADAESIQKDAEQLQKTAEKRQKDDVMTTLRRSFQGPVRGDSDAVVKRVMDAERLRAENEILDKWDGVAPLQVGTVAVVEEVWTKNLALHFSD